MQSDRSGRREVTLPTLLPVLHRPPVTLRAFEDRDAPVVAAASRDPLIPLITTVPSTDAAEDLRAYIGRQHDRLKSGHGYSFAVADVASGEAVGQIGLWTLDAAAGRATTGYWIAPESRRRGYARAALAAVTDWAFTIDEIARVQLHVEPWNEASWRAAESCGYQREGLLRSWQLIGDERKDMYVYSVVRDADATRVKPH